MTAALLAALTAPALAVGSSADIELVRPTFAEGSALGVDSPIVDAGGTVRAGVALQYERDPLILYERQEETGVVVSNRQAVLVGASWDLGKVVSVRLSLPTALQVGSEVPELARDGAALGDASAGFRLQLHQGDRFAVGLHADLLLPTSTRYAWMGEPLPRGHMGVLTETSVGHLDVLAQVSVIARLPVQTEQDFTLGSELAPALAARYHVVPGRAALAAAVVARGGLSYLGQGGAENPSEALTGLELSPRHDLELDIGFGKGLSRGYGTTEFRAFTELTWTHRRRPPEPLPQILITEVPDERPQVIVKVIEDPDAIWAEDELARVEGEKIVIRDPIQFEFATSRILPESLPTLRYVAQLLNDNWQIAQIVIEGHASEEGSYSYNYDLSERRARAVWEELIRAGAHPDRMSYRGLGETVPVSPGEDEASLARNRRVEFRIVRQYAPDEQPDQLRGAVRLPWSGEPADVTSPEPPPRPEPPPTRPEPEGEPKLDLRRFLDDDDDQGTDEEPDERATKGKKEDDGSDDDGGEAP